MPESPSTLNNPLQPRDKEAETVSAYYSLVFPSVSFYVRRLSVSIGRRCPPNPAATPTAPEPTQVDVDLGALKSVSRLHAKIEYDQEEDRFVFVVVGRNGAWVDGVWCPRGSRTPLGERSQIQIASRTFHFVLPPPPPPEDTPSPSSLDSTQRLHSPSVDIPYISPPSTPQSRSPPPKPEQLDSLPPELQLPAPRPAIKKNSKKRKKSEATKPRATGPLPEKRPSPMLPLIIDSIRGVGGKGTLQELCSWIAERNPQYNKADDKWTSSIRYTLTSDKHFKKLDKCTDSRGKGYFWALADDDSVQPMVVERLPSVSTKSKGKGKGKAEPAEPPAEPPTIVEVVESASVTPPPSSPAPPESLEIHRESPVPTMSAPSAPIIVDPPPPPIPTATVTMSVARPSVAQPSLPSGVYTYSTLSTSAPPTQWIRNPVTQASPPPPKIIPTPPPPQPVAGPSTAPSQADASITIILGPIPPTHPDYSPSYPNNSAKKGYVVLHDRTLILDPSVFSGLAADRLKEFENMGALKAVAELTTYMVRVRKERRAARGRGRGRGRGAGPPRDRREATAIPNTAAISGATSSRPVDDPLLVDDSDGEPAAKRRKVDDSVPMVP
ncbi:hypothetical protein MKEN_00066200 [Mycena kentingensis (nom. inval.)]|nr:hypothetical protein MKEN_00066200 [Mycena kentingensis (nom. inval.)]